MKVSKVFNFSSSPVVLSQAVENNNGQIQLKDIRTPGSTFFVDYSSGYDNQWDASGGSLLLFEGDCNIIDDYMDLTGNLKQYVSYAISHILNKTKGSVVFEYTPNYVPLGFYPEPPEVGQPIEPLDDYIIYCDGSLNVVSLRVTHKRNNSLCIEIFNNGGALLSSFSVELKLSFGVKYNFRINFDLSVAVDEIAIDLFLNDSHMVSPRPEYGQKVIMGDERANVDTIVIGNDLFMNNKSNFAISKLALFTQPQNQGVLENIYPRIYPMNPQVCEITETITASKLLGMGDIIKNSVSGLSFVFGVKDSFSDQMKYKYYDESFMTWMPSDFSVWKSNESLTETMLRMLLIDSSEVKIFMILRSPDGYTTPKINGFTMKYDFIYNNFIEIYKSLVYINFVGVDKSKCKMVAKLNEPTVYDGKFEMFNEQYVSVSDDNGYAAFLLPTTDKMLETSFYNFSLYCNDVAYKSVKLRVPAVEKVSFHELKFEIN